MDNLTKKVAKAYIEMLEAKEKKKEIDTVNKSELSGEFDDREDQDIDNNGKVDSSDKYLHKKRKAITKNVDNKKDEALDMSEMAKKKGYYEGFEIVQENEDGTVDAFYEGELHVGLTEEKAKELKHANVAAAQKDQEKMEPRAKGEKDFVDQHTNHPKNEKKDEEEIIGADTTKMTANVKVAPKRPADKSEGDKTMPSVEKVKGQ